jgi:hypothetical protein
VRRRVSPHCYDGRVGGKSTRAAIRYQSNRRVTRFIAASTVNSHQRRLLAEQQQVQQLAGGADAASKGQAGAPTLANV